MPWTPLSFAGVARRTMYREAAWNAAAYNVAATNAATANMAYANAYAAQTAAANANAAAAQAAAANALLPLPPPSRAAAALPIGSTVPYLPPDCTSSVINGTNYFNCNGVYYKAGFQGNNVVYIRVTSRQLGSLFYVVAGYTDNVGTEKVNYDLARLRADRVASY